MRRVRALTILCLASCGGRVLAGGSGDAGDFDEGGVIADADASETSAIGDTAVAKESSTPGPDAGGHADSGAPIYCSGPMCQCPANSTCINSCHAGVQCFFYCAPGSTCFNDCDNGAVACIYTCPAGSNCVNSCGGGGCEDDCNAGSTCTNSCAGGDCLMNCEVGASCSWTCSGGGCQG